MVLSHLCQGFGAPEQCTKAEEEAKAANYLVTEIDRPARARRWRLMSTPPIFFEVSSPIWGIDWCYEILLELKKCRRRSLVRGKSRQS